ncbi:Growth factor receptor cysteine-rich [Gracilaria domingensis]|nr:Growth factor receptor cysteine-rich [Gracilaria domingensis]
MPAVQSRPYRGYLDVDGCEKCPGDEVHDYEGDCGCRGPLAQNVGMTNETCSTRARRVAAGRSAVHPGGENECVKCPAGTFRAVATMERLRSSACYRCPATKPCEKCAPGFVPRRGGAASCEKCPAGSFQLFSATELAT